MSNVPYIAAHLTKKAGKEELFNIVKKASSGNQLTENDLAKLYAYFLPPKSKTIKNAFDWASLVCDQKESYAFCKYLLVEGGVLYSANTKVAHIVHDSLGLEDNWYDTQKGRVGDDLAIMPNIKAAFAEAVGIETTIKLESLEIVETPTGLAYILPWNQKGVSKDYFDKMFLPLENPEISYSLGGAFSVTGLISGIKATAVIMAFEVAGYQKQATEEVDTVLVPECQLEFFS